MNYYGTRDAKNEYGKNESKSGMTSLWGLPVYMDFAVSSGLLKLIDENLKALVNINTGLTGFEAVKPCEETATLDMDASFPVTRFLAF